MKEKTCRFGHECTSGCQKDFDCPCLADHCCALTTDCEGCDDHYTEPTAVETAVKELREVVKDNEKKLDKLIEVMEVLKEQLENNDL